MAAVQQLGNNFCMARSHYDASKRKMPCTVRRYFGESWTGKLF